MPSFRKLMVRSLSNVRQFVSEIWPILFVVGDVLFLSALGKPIVVLNSFEAVNHLLNQRASIYSDRPQSVMASELYWITLFARETITDVLYVWILMYRMGWEKTVPVSRYNDNWRVQRKIWSQLMNKNAVKMFSGITEKESRMLASRILDNPLKFFSDIRL